MNSTPVTPDYSVTFPNFLLFFQWLNVFYSECLVKYQPTEEDELTLPYLGPSSSSHLQVNSPKLS